MLSSSTVPVPKTEAEDPEFANILQPDCEPDWENYDDSVNEFLPGSSFDVIPARSSAVPDNVKVVNTKFVQLQRSLNEFPGFTDADLAQDRAYDAAMGDIDKIIADIKSAVAMHRLGKEDEEPEEEEEDSTGTSLPMPAKQRQRYHLLRSYPNAQYVFLVPAWKTGLRRTQGSQTIPAYHLVPKGAITGKNEAFRQDKVAWKCKTTHTFGWGAGFDIYLSSDLDSCPYCETSRRTKKAENGIDQDWVFPKDNQILLQKSEKVELKDGSFYWAGRDRKSRYRENGNGVEFTRGMIVHDGLTSIKKDQIIGHGPIPAPSRPKPAAAKVEEEDDDEKDDEKDDDDEEMEQV